MSSYFVEIFFIVIGALSLALFICGLALTFFELATVGASVLAVGGGLVGLCLAVILWLLAPNIAKYFGVEKSNPKKRCYDGKASVPMLFEDERDLENLKNPSEKKKYNRSPYTINPDSTELLMRSIRGIPYLIQVYN